MFGLLQLLAGAGVNFVLVGGLAVALHGYQRLTMDVDVVLAMDEENLQRFIECARKAGLQPLLPVSLDSLAQADVLAQWRRERNLLAFSLHTRDAQATTLDILIQPAVTYEALRKQASQVAIGSLSIPVASIEHLIAMKTGTGRSKDLVDIEELRKIQQAHS